MGGSHKQGRGLIIRQIKQHHVSEGLMNLYYNVCKFRLEKQHQQNENLKQVFKFIEIIFQQVINWYYSIMIRPLYL
jgi:predicted solute-binding protein